MRATAARILFSLLASCGSIPCHKIVLINGKRLAELMIDYGVGVSTRETYVLKRTDEDYFAEG